MHPSGGKAVSAMEKAVALHGKEFGVKPRYNLTAHY